MPRGSRVGEPASARASSRPFGQPDARGAVAFQAPRLRGTCRISATKAFLAIVVAVGLLLIAVPGYAARFDSCADVRAYFKSPLPEDPYAREQDLKKALDVLQGATPSEACDDWMIERAYFELATARDEFSRTFRDDPQATRFRAAQAARTYGEYLDWFLALPEARRDRLIRLLTRTQSVPDDEFRAERRRWLRLRVGNVLNSMGASFVRAEVQDELLAAYERYFRDSIEIFPNEVARKWHKWLRAMPDFATEKPDAQVGRLIAENSAIRSQWQVFEEFLEAFLQANPSVRREWDPVARRVKQWLLQSS